MRTTPTTTRRSRYKLRVVRRDDKLWYIIGVPPYMAEGFLHTEYGPYQNKVEAAEDKAGVERTLEIMAAEGRL